MKNFMCAFFCSFSLEAAGAEAGGGSGSGGGGGEAGGHGHERNVEGFCCPIFEKSYPIFYPNDSFEFSLTEYADDTYGICLREVTDFSLVLQESFELLKTRVHNAVMKHDHDMFCVEWILRRLESRETRNYEREEELRKELIELKRMSKSSVRARAASSLEPVEACLRRMKDQLEAYEALISKEAASLEGIHALRVEILDLFAGADEDVIYILESAFNICKVRIESVRERSESFLSAASSVTAGSSVGGV